MRVYLINRLGTARLAPFRLRRSRENLVFRRTYPRLAPFRLNLSFVKDGPLCFVAFHIVLRPISRNQAPEESQSLKNQ